jgi:hypothetical protein
VLPVSWVAVRSVGKWLLLLLLGGMPIGDTGDHHLITSALACSVWDSELMGTMATVESTGEDRIGKRRLTYSLGTGALQSL